ncbi:hypothetical protein BK669_18015 [Pseudomonas fluorescens]|nr:hypothetical protein BK669_18015 [Pseudomonas fluorescens]
MLDVISNGRMEVGLARGAYQVEFDRMAGGMLASSGGQALRGKKRGQTTFSKYFPNVVCPHLSQFKRDQFKSHTIIRISDIITQLSN